MSHSAPTLQVRGESAYLLPASPALRGLALIIDLGVAWIAFCVAIIGAKIPPVPHAWMAAALAVGTLALRLLQRYLFGVTFGERVWDLRSGPNGPDGLGDWLRPRLRQCNPLPSNTLSLGTFLTLLSVIFGFWMGYETVLQHPLSQSAPVVEWDAYMPPLSLPGALSGTSPAAPALPREDRWSVMAFYYSLGAWPRTFQGNDVFYSLPYEKGPPIRFTGEVVARWSMPEVRVSFEGPKTPLKRDHSLFSRSEVEQCVTHWLGGSLSGMMDCLDLREAVLERHIDALRLIKPVGWSMKWLRVNNPSLPASEQVQGIYLSAWNRGYGQDRFILVTEKGTQQTFVLSYTISPEGNHAQELFQKAIRSLRVSDDLSPGRAWVDTSLERVRLQDLAPVETSRYRQDYGSFLSFASRIADIQSLLISKITVDPQSYDAYFHLGGTSLLLARYASLQKSLPGVDRDLGRANRISDLISQAKPMVQTAYRYAQDVGPGNKRTALLQGYWFDAQKL